MMTYSIDPQGNCGIWNKVCLWGIKSALQGGHYAD